MIRSHQRSFALGVALLACLATLLSTTQSRTQIVAQTNNKYSSRRGPVT